MKVTPFCQNMRARDYDPMASLAREGRHTILPLSGYDERATIETASADPHDACEELWTTYQNIDETRRTPDGGRSLMTGDMARVEDGDDVIWFICCSIGWTETRAPGDAIQRIGDRPAEIAAGIGAEAL